MNATAAPHPPEDKALAVPQTLSEQDIAQWHPAPIPTDALTPLARARQRMQRAGQWQPWQVLGRRMAIGCVALEITQRCNLDCSYCYLSESSEALKDIPLQEVLRRVDLIHAHYGRGTDVQVTGGDPTLRARSELLQIVRHIRAKGMRASLFTNGIKASRELLQQLCEAGLEDVAFHVDITQGRAGYRSEADLNAVRLEYLERARGLPLAVFFNTTVTPENFGELPALVRFFARHCDVVRMAAFQLGADTGRGTERARVAINPDTVQAQIEAGARTRLTFDAASAGHARCNRYAIGLVLHERMVDFFQDPAFVQEMLLQTAHLPFHRRSRWHTVRVMSAFLLQHPRLLLGFARRVLVGAWQHKADLWAARGRVGKLSFHLHNFQDAKALDPERCESCSFMVMTPEGPLSMCVHNAKRDQYLLVPAQVQQGQAVMFWNPATGQLQRDKPGRIDVALTRKNARGRAKQGLQPGAAAAGD
jgi:7,8-dihydro-6-hydroxymethylpterin dimethyltransferase